MTRTVGCVQSNYIPWKGYFDLIHDVDLFVFHDTVQYTKLDWRNRNRIKTAAGCRWLTIPVGTQWRGAIRDVELPRDAGWAARHWRMLEQSYRHAPFFDDYAARLRPLYEPDRFRTLSELNQALTRTIATDALGIDTQFVDSADHPVAGARLERLLLLLRSVGATRYVSGPAAKSYIDPRRFAEAGIELVWKSYDGYPEYDQLHPPFEHAVTVLDLLVHVGPAAPHYIWGWRRERGRPMSGA